MLRRYLLVIVALLLQLSSRAEGNGNAVSVRRPFYIIAHMTNSVPTMDYFLREGANAIEVDLSFESDGTALRLYHGVPCDMLRICHESTEFAVFLRSAASREMSLMFLDIKSSALTEKAKIFAGIDIARKLVANLYNMGGEKLNVVLSIQHTSEKPLLGSFISEMKILRPRQLERISFDISENPDFRLAALMFSQLNVTSAWQGDGVTNWFETFRGYRKVRNAIKARNTNRSYIKKVYRWTVDHPPQMRNLIAFGIDGIMTNAPGHAYKIVRNNKKLRMATKDDNINVAFGV